MNSWKEILGFAIVVGVIGFFFGVAVMDETRETRLEDCKAKLDTLTTVLLEKMK